MAHGYPRDLLERVLGDYEAARDPERAAAMSRYMRDRFPFFGIAAPARRVIDRRAQAEAGPPPDASALAAAARTAWSDPRREPQYMASELLARHVGVVGPAGLDLCAELITTKSWWDTVDAIAAHVVGPLVRTTPGLVGEVDRWARGDDMWLARAAIIHQLGFRERTDAGRLFEYARLRAGDEEFFIRKAIGWSLRQYARTDPDAVRAFVTAHATSLSPLSRAEAMKHLGGDPLRPTRPPAPPDP